MIEIKSHLLHILGPVEILDSQRYPESLVFFFRWYGQSELNNAAIGWLSSKVSCHFLHWLAIDLDVCHEVDAFFYGNFAEHLADYLLFVDSQTKHIGAIRSEWAEKTQNAELLV